MLGRFDKVIIILRSLAYLETTLVVGQIIM